MALSCETWPRRTGNHFAFHSGPLSVFILPTHPQLKRNHKAGFKVFTKIGKMQVKPPVTPNLHPLGWLLLNTQKTTRVGEDVEAREPWALLLGKYLWGRIRSFFQE